LSCKGLDKRAEGVETRDEKEVTLEPTPEIWTSADGRFGIVYVEENGNLICTLASPTIPLYHDREDAERALETLGAPVKA
jgi:hypothetical protein